MWLMARCPECGGYMKTRMKRKVCETCGLSLSPSEYDHEWSKIRDSQYEEKDKKRRQNDYLKWYQSSKE